jgi:glycosyltransferase involved in cell wall biosynthesis
MSARIRIAVLVSHPIQYFVPLYRALSERTDVDLTVLFCDAHGVRPSFDRGFGETIRFDVPLLEGFKYRFIRNRAPRPGLTLTGLVNPEALGEITSGAQDAIVVHGYQYLTYLSALVAPKRRARVLLRGDSQLLPTRSLSRRIAKQIALRTLFSRVDHFLAIGSRNREYYRAYGVNDERISLAPYSVDNEYFASRSQVARRDPASARRRLGLPTGGPLFLFSGKLIRLKRIFDTLNAFALARAAGPCGLVYVGSGELRGDLERAIAAAGLADSVVLLGFRNQGELPEIYGCSDVLLLPSDSESWGLAINEALACGMTAFVSNVVGAAPDLVADPACIFSPGDVDRLGEAMRRAVADPDWLSARKDASARRIRHWGLKETADGWVEGVRVALGRPAR